MQIQQLISLNNTHCHIEGVSKKRILETCSELIAESAKNLDSDTVFSALLNRERLGSTGFGEGVAIPHCRLEDCDQAHALLLTLDTPIDFDAFDKKPVDLLIVLVVPDNAADGYLEILSQAVALFDQESSRLKLRACESTEALYSTLVQLTDKNA